MAVRPESPEGTFRLHRRFRSQLLASERDLAVWLPPGCDGRRRRHPVVYFHDGQNVFDPATAFGGNPWHAHRAALERMRAQAIAPAILVGIYNAGANRIHEYTPTRGDRNAPHERSRGQLRPYACCVATEIVPLIDGRYPTLDDPAQRALVGSSLGGLAALYGALWYPAVFGAAGVMSPSVWWDDLAVVRFIESLKRKLPVRLWLDIGTAEEGWEKTRALRAALAARGWREPIDLHYREVIGAEHTERAWAARIGDALQWMLPRAIVTPQV